MILGYVMKAKDCNDGLFFDGSEPTGVLCPNCGTCLDYRYAPSAIDIHPSKKYDVSYTQDLRDLFSTRFVTFCRDVLHCDEGFKLVKGTNMDLFYMFPSRVLEFDVERRKTRFEKSCNVCGGYESIVGARPAFLRTKEPIGPGFYRSDIAFGSGKSKFPLFFVGAEWKELLASQKFRGIEFDEITE